MAQNTRTECQISIMEIAINGFEHVMLDFSHCTLITVNKNSIWLSLPVAADCSVTKSQLLVPPVWFSGHSRSVVGLEQKKNGSFCVLLLDPSSSVSDCRKLLSRDTWSTAVRFIRKFPRNLKHRQYQLVSVQGVLSAEDKQVSRQKQTLL